MKDIFNEWVAKGVASDPHDFNHSCTCPPGFEGKNCESCTDDLLSCKSESNEMNCILPDAYCKSGNTMECTISLDFFCRPELVKKYCTEDQFACINEYGAFLNFCIPKEKKCDGNPECPNGKDEEGCVDTCNAEEVQCIHEKGKKLPLECILPAKQCDGISDCELNGEDEMGCLPWWIWLIIIVLLIVVLITVYCIWKRKREPNQEKITQTEIEAPTIITQTEIEAPTITTLRCLLNEPARLTILMKFSTLLALISVLLT